MDLLDVKPGEVVEIGDALVAVVVKPDGRVRILVEGDVRVRQGRDIRSWARERAQGLIAAIAEAMEGFKRQAS